MLVPLRFSGRSPGLGRYPRRTPRSRRATSQRACIQALLHREQSRSPVSCKAKELQLQVDTDTQTHRLCDPNPRRWHHARKLRKRGRLKQKKQVLGVLHWQAERLVDFDTVHLLEHQLRDVEAKIKAQARNHRRNRGRRLSQKLSQNLARCLTELRALRALMPQKGIPTSQPSAREAHLAGNLRHKVLRNSRSCLLENSGGDPLQKTRTTTPNGIRV